MLAGADVRLVVPLLVWFALYLLLVRWTMARVGPASKAASDARSAVTGRVVDSYTNIHSVKLFAHDDTEIAWAGEAIENTRKNLSGRDADIHQNGCDACDAERFSDCWRCGLGLSGSG